MTVDPKKALAVVSSARKVTFLVPDGNVVDFPEGVTISKYGQNNENPVVVVCNHTDNGGTWQGADSENGIIIMNEVEPNLANELLDMFEENPTIDGLKAVITRAEGMGAIDNYTTKVSFADSKLSPAGRMLDNYTGIVKRDDRDVCYIFRDSEGVIWRMLDGNVKHIEEAILLRTYVTAEGDKINPALIPVV